jgi:zinc transport system substrate-binding protein
VITFSAAIARGLPIGKASQLVRAAFMTALCVGVHVIAENERVSPLRVVVAIPPHKYFAERVGGEQVKVKVLLAPGQSPATFEPTPKQIADLSEAQVYFRAGVPFENRLVEKIRGTVRDLHIVDTRRDIELLHMSEPHEHGDSEQGPVSGERTGNHQTDAGQQSDQEHAGRERTFSAHEESDPHVWMNPRLAATQARTICDELCRLDPDHAAYFQGRLRSLLDDLNRLDKRIAGLMAPFRGREFFVFHPAFSYFAEAYGLTQVAVESGGKEPAGKELASFVRRAERAGARVIFVQPQFSSRSANALAREIGGVVAPLDPLAEDYLVNLEHVAKSIRKALLGETEGVSE